MQCGASNASYNRSNKQHHMRYDDLIINHLSSKEMCLTWLKDIGLIASEMKCHQCLRNMTWTETKDRSDGFKWVCYNRTNGKRHLVEKSIRSKTFFDKSNMTIEEVLKYTYWWSQNLKQSQIRTQLGLSPNSGVDWDMFCREVCEIVVNDDSMQIGGPGKTVQIDESKIGKRKYQRGHRVEGQWVFGGIEEDSRNCFIFEVEDRTEDTLISIIDKWIAKGTLIVSDCWKSYSKLSRIGYSHETMNHSKEFKNRNGNHTNKIEGHWRQMKSHLPSHGRCKFHYSYYLAEFLWRYKNRGNDLFVRILTDIKRIYDPNSNANPPAVFQNL